MNAGEGICQVSYRKDVLIYQSGPFPTIETWNNLLLHLAVHAVSIVLQHSLSHR